MGHQINQAAGGGYQNVGATSEPHHLRVDGHAPKNDRDLAKSSPLSC